MRPHRLATGFAAALVLSAAVSVFAASRAGMGSPDRTYQDALTALHDAGRDTVGHADDAGRLDALGLALLKLARFADADRLFRRVLAANPADGLALAGAGHVALCRNDAAAAESLLLLAGDAEGAKHDLYLARLRRHEYAAAAAMAEGEDEGGRHEMLAALDGRWPPTGPIPGRDGTIAFVRAWPAPLVHVMLNGRQVLMAIDPGAPELLLDPAAAHRGAIEDVPGDHLVAWCGARVPAEHGFVQKLELGPFTLTGVPAAVTPLHKYSLAVNPEGADIAGVLGLSVLERLGVTLDFRRQVLELRSDRGAPASTRYGVKVPFERWGEGMLVVYGSVEGARRMAFQVGTGLPDGGLGAPQETFDEIGAQPGHFANFMRTVGSALQGRAWSQVVVSSLTIGSVASGRLDSWSGAMNAAELWRSGARLDGLLGPKFFENRRVTFDWTRNELVFEGKDRR